jgi:hypothetical protein
MKRFLILFSLCITGNACFSQSADTIKLNNAYVESLTTTRMHLSNKSQKDVYKTIVTFRKKDSSLFVLTFRGQEPLPMKSGETEELILPIVNGVKCYFEPHHYYDLIFIKTCKYQLNGFPYYKNFAEFDSADCSLIAKPYNGKKMKHRQAVQLMHPYVEIDRHLYQMDVFGCTTKFKSYDN